MEEVTKYILPDELYHHGIKGMKWGIRRHLDGEQKPSKPRNMYGHVSHRSIKKRKKELEKHYRNEFLNTENGKEYDKLLKRDAAMRDLSARKQMKNYKPLSDKDYDREIMLSQKSFDYVNHNTKQTLQTEFGKQRMSKFDKRRKRAFRVGYNMTVAGLTTVAGYTIYKGANIVKKLGNTIL